MSLINEALKKAQRLRSDDPADLVAPVPGATAQGSRRSQPRSSQSLLLLASGGLVLIVLSVVITFWLANRPASEKPGVKPAAPKLAATGGGPAPAIVPPVIKPPAASATEMPAAKPAPSVPARTATPPADLIPAPSIVAPQTADPSAVVAAPAAVSSAEALTNRPALPSVALPESASVAATLPPASPATLESYAPAAPPKTDARVHAFVDAIKVTGIRSSGGDSRVLMNDRVFRVNDIVERNLGVRLTQVEADALTFTDGNGATYVKHF